MGKELKVAGQLAPGAARTLGYGAELAQVGGIQHEDLIRLTKDDALEDDGLGFVDLYTGNKLISPEL